MPQPSLTLRLHAALKTVLGGTSYRSGVSILESLYKASKAERWSTREELVAGTDVSTKGYNGALGSFASKISKLAKLTKAQLCADGKDWADNLVITDTKQSPRRFILRPEVIEAIEMLEAFQD